MAFPFPTFCPFEDGQEHLSLVHVARPETGKRCYTLPIGVVPQHTDQDVLQLEAAINETEAHLATLKTQVWLRSVLVQWEAHFPTIEALRMNRATEMSGDEEWRFELWHRGVSSETNRRGFTRRPPWEGIENPPDDRYRRENPQIEAATKLLRNLLVDFPQGSLPSVLMDELFDAAPQGKGLNRKEWETLVFSTMPASVVPESRALALAERLPSEQIHKPDTGPRL